ncbi:MAG: hypothetical protein Q9167_007097 [Letrouitia subvulpina]
MLRIAAPLARQTVFKPGDYFIATRWSPRRCPPSLLSAQTYADARKPSPETKPSIHDSDTVVLPGSQSQTAKGPTPPAPGKVETTAKPPTSPAAPSSDTSIPPENVPLVPPQPPGSKVQTAPPTSVPPDPLRDTNRLQSTKPPSTTPPGSEAPRSPPPPPPPPKRKPRRFRNFLIAVVFLSATGFAGGTYYSLVSDNFHDFFTEYVPFGEEAVLYFEEREFRRRFPSVTKPTNRPDPPSNIVTIPSKSGVSWKVLEEEQGGSDLAKRGRHMSALDANPPNSAVRDTQQQPSGSTPKDKIKAVESAKKKEAPPNPTPKKPDSPKEKPKTETPPVPKEKPKAEASSAPKEAEKPQPIPPSPVPAAATESEPKKVDTGVRPPEVNEPSRIMPTSRIDPLKIQNADEPLVQDLVKIFNDIISVVNADNAQAIYSSTIDKAKAELAGVGKRIVDLKEAERSAADKRVKEINTEFDNAAKELVRRLEQEMNNQAVSWKDEFESEREKMSQSYENRLGNEVKRDQEVFDQKLHNELLQQAITLRREFISEVKDRVENERSGRLSKLSSLSTSVSELENLTSSWNSVIDSNLKTQHLLVAMEAVRSTIENADRPRPFVNELATLKELATDDPVVSAAIASINPTAYQRGIPTTSQLVDRFRRVAGEVRKASLVPDDAGAASHAVSFVLSKFMFKKKGMTLGDDVESVLTRTETLLEEGRLDEAAREMNALQGWAKHLSVDWLGEVRRVLEVRQAMDVMGTEARLLGLAVK